jgi:ankyrin repeat protein
MHQQFKAALYNHDVPTIEKLLCTFPYSNLCLWTLLLSCWIGDLNIVKMIFKYSGTRWLNAHGPKYFPKWYIHDLNYLSGWTALTLAVYSAWPDVVATVLATTGIDVNVPSSVERLGGRTPLIYAILLAHRVENPDPAIIIKMLLANEQINVNDTDAQGSTALHIAVCMRDLSVSALYALVKHANININIRDNNGRTALHVLTNPFNGINTALTRQTMSILLAVDGIDVNALDLFWTTPLSNVIANTDFQDGDLPALQMLLDHPGLEKTSTDGRLNTPLHVAVGEAASHAVESMVKIIGLQDSNTRNEAGETPLLMAIYRVRRSHDGRSYNMHGKSHQ